MYKFMKMVFIALLVILSLQQTAFAVGQASYPPKPTEGVESSDPNHGSSKDIESVTSRSASGLLYNWYCSIDNTGSNLYLEGTTAAKSLVDKVKVTLYLQKWDDSKWVDIKNWTFQKYDAKRITDGAFKAYQRGNYYRTRALHYVKDGTQEETQYSTSSFIYVE